MIAPYEKRKGRFVVSRVLLVGYPVEMWEADTPNPKYNLNPIAHKYGDGKLKSIRRRS